MKLVNGAKHLVFSFYGDFLNGTKQKFQCILVELENKIKLGRWIWKKRQTKEGIEEIKKIAK